MSATTTTTTMTGTSAVVLLLLLCSCHCSAQDQERAKSQHDHVRTKSGSAQTPRAQLVTDGMPPLAASIGGDDDIGDDDDDTTPLGAKDEDGSKLREYLFRRPSNMFLGLLRTGVDVVQHSMDTFQGVSTKIFHVARHRIRSVHGRPTGSTTRAIASSTANNVPGPANGGGGSGSGSGGTSAPVKSKAKGQKYKFPADLGKSMFKMIDTGIAGIEQVTDLGFLLGNIGTHKIRAGLDGKSGNQEIFNLLIKYVGSRVGMGSKGSPVQMIDDIGTISTFVATDDQVTKSISVLMERMMANPEVSAAMVRTAITVLDSSPSTSCILDQLPLSPSDVRLAFDVFVGSNGQMMLKTIAGLLSDLTTGPDTRAFLESVMGMMSMFKSNSPTPSDSTQPEKSTSFFGSLNDFFIGSNDNGGVTDPQQTAASSPTPPPPTPVNRRKNRERVKKPRTPVVEDPWFTDDDDDDAFRSSTMRSVKRDPDLWSNDIDGDVKTSGGESKSKIGRKKSKTQSSKRIKNKQPTSYEDDD